MKRGMIACRNFLRIDSLINFTKRHYKANLTCFQSVSQAGNNMKAMGGNKKQKMVNRVWRPISTQTRSIEESQVKSVLFAGEDGKEVEEVCSKVVGKIAVAQVVTEAGEAANVVDDVKGGSSNIFEQENSQGESCISDDKHSSSLEVGASVMRFIRGREGSTQKMIEEEFGVKIIFPSSKKEDLIVIEGNSADDVKKASGKIQTIIDEAIKSPNFTYSHFVSLPLAIHPELVEKLISFQNSILGNDNEKDENSDCELEEVCSENEDDNKRLEKGSNVSVEMKVAEGSSNVTVDLKSVPLISYHPKTTKTPNLLDRGIDKSIFIKPKTFHLTVLMLKLWNKEKIKVASDVLKGILPKVIEALNNRPVYVRLKGLDSMRGSLAKTRVLYATVEEVGNEGRLLNACKVITEAFVEAGLVLERDAKQSLKLHATVMNTSHRRRKKRSWKLDTFDARDIYKQYGHEEWGEYLIREAHLSQRFLYDENGYYHCCASIPFPETTRARFSSETEVG